MEKAIIGQKLGMTQIFQDDGKMIPVTIVKAGPCVVVQVKNIETDGYEAVQIGYGDLKANKVKKPMAGHFAKGDVAPKRTLKEFRLANVSTHTVGDIIKTDIFTEGEQVDVTGTSKGKGYAGVIKRWGFSRLKMSHGTGPVARKGGSIGMCSTPSRVHKGKKMNGRMGGERVTIQNLTVISVDAENNIIAIKGAIPGPKNSIVVIKDTVKK